MKHIVKYVQIVKWNKEKNQYEDMSDRVNFEYFYCPSEHYTLDYGIAVSRKNYNDMVTVKCPVCGSTVGGFVRGKLETNYKKNIEDVRRD